MDSNRVKFAMMLAIGFAAVFILMFVRRFLSMVKFSLRAVVCTILLVVICVAFWMARDPIRNDPRRNDSAPRPTWQSETPGPMRR
jgi:hypothetical protein